MNILQMLLGNLLMKKLREPSKKKLCLDEVMAWFDTHAVLVRKNAGGTMTVPNRQQSRFGGSSNGVSTHAPNDRTLPMFGRLQRSKKGGCSEVVAQIFVLSQGQHVLATSEVWLASSFDEPLQKAFGLNLAMNITL